MKLFFTACCCIFLFSCNPNRVPADVLPPEKMKAVLWDYINADIFATDYLSKDSAAKSKNTRADFQESALRKNKTDRETFTRSYTWYEAHDKMMQPMLDSMIAQQSRALEKERSKQIK